MTYHLPNMSEPMLQATNLVKHFRTRGGVVRAVDGVELAIGKGETLGLVGESGCGKSTLGRLLIQLIAADAGEMHFAGRRAFSKGSGAAQRASGDAMPREVMPLREFRRRVQIVFQDPFRSLNPRRTAGQAIAEPLLIHGLASGNAVWQQVGALMSEVGLDAAAMHRYPHEFSGGQRQRIGIARALAVQPDLIVLDEPVAALDVSVQAQIVRLLMDLQAQRGLSYLFISHNLAVVRHIASRVAVMYLGKIVEVAAAGDLYASPRHPYTRALLEAVPEPDLSQPLQPELRGDAPDPIAVPSGCRFHPRCRLAREVAREDQTASATGSVEDELPAICRHEEPPLREVAPHHRSACHFAERLAPR